MNGPLIKRIRSEIERICNEEDTYEEFDESEPLEKPDILGFYDDFVKGDRDRKDEIILYLIWYIADHEYKEQ